MLQSGFILTLSVLTYLLKKQVVRTSSILTTALKMFGEKLELGSVMNPRKKRAADIITLITSIVTEISLPEKRFQRKSFE